MLNSSGKMVKCRFDGLNFSGVNLLRAVDRTKCQTLFLSQVSQHALQRALFPVGDMLKVDVKDLAKKAGLEKIAKRKEVSIRHTAKHKLYTLYLV